MDSPPAADSLLSQRRRGRMTGYAEVIPGDPIALLLPACRQARSYRLYCPVVRQAYRLRTLGPEAQFVGGVLRIEGIFLHPTRSG
jgi:hypothetical protein